MKKFTIVFFACCLITEILQAQYTVIHNFNDTLGANPLCTLTLSGNTLFGVAPSGGASDSGCIFSIKTDGTGYTDLHDFSGQEVVNGTGSLTLLGNTLYGTTTKKIYSIQTDGTNYKDIANIYVLCDSEPGLNSSLVLSAGDSLFYGSTQYGHRKGKIYTNGNIFSIHTDGSGYKNIYYFDTTAHSDSDIAPGPIVYSQINNAFYGIASAADLSQYWHLYSLRTNGTGPKELESFSSSNGRGPGYSVILSNNDTMIYGMSSSEPSGGQGFIYKIKPNGTGYKDMYDFTLATGIDGEYPVGNLLLAGNGKLLYGMTPQGGKNGTGNIFSITTSGTFTNLYTTIEGTNGQNPEGSLIASVTGDTLFGTTKSGGTEGYGVIFAFIVNSSPTGVPTINQALKNMVVYPNPATNKIQCAINSDDNTQAHLNIYDMVGQLLLTENIYLTKGSNTIYSDLTGLSSGTYLVEINSQLCNQTQKLVILK